MAMSLAPAFLRTRSLAASVAAAWLVACSAGVDRYHVQDKGTHGGANAGGDGFEDGGATGSGGEGEGGDVPSYGGASSGGGRQGGSGGANAGGAGKPPGSGGKGELSTGGSTLMTSGGTAGASGGATSGGSAGKASGGAGNGGTGSGGIGTGGAGTGGATGGTGGMSTTGPGDPQPVPVSDLSLTGISAAAWDGTKFLLLEPAANRFWPVDPKTGTLGASLPLPPGVIAPNAFGVSGPGVSQGVFVIAGGKVYRVPRATGYTSETGAALPTLNKASGTFAGSYFLIGDLYNSGSMVAHATDANGGLVSANALGAIYAVGSDGSNFAYSTLDSGAGATMHIRHTSGSSLTANGFACVGGDVGTGDAAVSVYKNTVAWIINRYASYMLLYIVSDTNGTCPAMPTPIQYATVGGGPTAVGLINETDAVVVEKFASGFGDIQILGRSGPHTSLKGMAFNGNALPKAIVVGAGHYAAIVSGYAPILVSF